ncbi:hypothetical protein [Rubellimicrobium arenae]|uniref:hypothetical protein n=1 Tax=Rubellimicrobium arenae TaxID=2817372 RepID=UPI001B318233|nr:hypothetical protein [Rubellimicrobium arenae]
MTLTRSYTEALERALARIVADGQRQIETQRLQSDAVLAQLQARVAEAEARSSALEAELTRRTDERLGQALAGFGQNIDARIEAAGERVSEALADLPSTPDLSGFVREEELAALAEQVDAVARSVDQMPPPDLAGLARVEDLEAVRAAIPAMPPAPDLSGFVEGSALAALEERLSRLEGTPQPKDWSEDLLALRADLAARTEAIWAAIPEVASAPDLSGYVQESALQTLKDRVVHLEEAPEPRDWTKDLHALRDGLTAEVDAIRAAIPSTPDLSGFVREVELMAYASVEHVQGAIRTAAEAFGAAIERTNDRIDALQGVVRDMGDSSAEITRDLVEGIRSEVRERLSRHPGRLPVCRDWEDRVHYAGELVRHEGSTWQAERDTGRAPPHADWICIASAGAPGERGASFTVRGTYDPGTTYAALDVVALDGSSFVARKDEPGPCPGAGWQLLASRGSKGRAADGLKGDPGAGVVGVSVSAEGLLILALSDGTTVEADLYPLLSKVSR